MTQPYIHPSLLFRRAPLEQVGGYSEDRFAVLCEDYDLLLRLYAKGFRGANLPNVCWITPFRLLQKETERCVTAGMKP